eukprot:scaffold262717_cov49-Prasinocladus_malaysianus.AAC.1
MCTIRLYHQACEARAFECLSVQPKDPAGGLVDHVETAPMVGGDDGVEGAVHDGPCLPLLGLYHLLLLLLFGDVPQNGREKSLAFSLNATHAYPHRKPRPVGSLALHLLDCAGHAVQEVGHAVLCRLRAVR